MEAIPDVPQENKHSNYCRLCGRPPWGALLGNCAACTNLFGLKKGRHLYSPATGRLWLKSVGNATLLNVIHTNDRTIDVQTANLSNQAPRVSWWGLLAVAGAILFMTLRFIFRVK